MTSIRYSVTMIAIAAAAALAGCGGEPQSYSLQGPAGQENVTVPKGTMLGGASAGQTTALAQEIADTNNNAMQQFDRLGGDMSKMQSTENKELPEFPGRAREARADLGAAGHRPDHPVLRGRLGYSRPVPIPASGQLPRLPAA